MRPNSLLSEHLHGQSQPPGKSPALEQKGGAPDGSDRPSESGGPPWALSAAPPPATHHRSLSGEGPIIEEVPELLAGDTKPAPTATSLLWSPRALAPHAVRARRGRAPGGERQEVKQQNGCTGQHTGGGQEGRGQRSRPENREPRRLEAQRARPPPCPTARTASLGPRQALAPEVGALAQKASFQGRYAFPGATGAKHTGGSLKRGWAVSVWRPESNIQVWVRDGGASVPGPAPASGALLAKYGVFRFVDDSPTAASVFTRPRPACTPVSKLPTSQEYRPSLQ